VNIHLVSNPPAWLALLVLPWAADAAHAQPPAPPAAASTPSAARTATNVFRSALDGYQPYTDEKTVDWKEANDNVGRIGGWREYAKEAGPAESEPQAPDAAAQPDPHAGHAKP
jgi:hypothetical protein